ncbi:MAG TPA: serine hydrolase [Chitinophagaceae bacterium]|nr:serine hydrolase [Chitinophagaceae bacterium]
MEYRLPNLLKWTFGLFFAGLISIPSSGQVAHSEKGSGKGKKSTIQNVPDSFIYKLLASYPQYFSPVLNKGNGLQVQIIYSRIDRDKKNRPVFTDHFWGIDTGQYFYPASTVKLPIALLALQRLNELKIAGLDLNSTMRTLPAGEKLTGVSNDPSAVDGRPSIAHYIRKILLVSDNDAFNRLYEFLGQEYINNTLRKMGYVHTEIIHRLNISLTEAENRTANAVQFFDSSGKLLYTKPEEKSRLAYQARNTRLGKGFIRGDQLVNEPFDFSQKNRLLLTDLHSMVRSILFPESMPKEKRFTLTPADYAFLRRYMSMLPAESTSPVYDTTAYWDNYVKFVYYGSEKTKPDPAIRIFNKVGDAYGFLIDAAYVADFSRQIEFMLSAVIYCNSDGIFNDDAYDYDTVGFPFLKHLGRMIYEYELKRPRKKIPDLSAFQFQYR